jgi:hypothetical protein
MSPKKFLAAVLIVTAIVGATAGAALAAGSSGPAVKVQVKSLTKTLLGPITVHGEKAAVTKGGTPKGKCTGSSAAGALDAATRGRWSGKWYSSVPGIFVTSILGVKPKNPDFWEIVVNGKVAANGICSIKLRAGQRLLFKVAK